jgi:hypothetical protein
LNSYDYAPADQKAYWPVGQYWQGIGFPWSSDREIYNQIDIFTLSTGLLQWQGRTINLVTELETILLPNLLGWFPPENRVIIPIETIVPPPNARTVAFSYRPLVFNRPRYGILIRTNNHPAGTIWWSLH